MVRRTRPRQIAKLVQVQHVRRATAHLALEAARKSEVSAGLLQDRARADAATAADDWSDLLAKPGFAPDYVAMLAVRLLAREAEANEAAEHFEMAASIHALRQDDWRLSEALVKLTETSLSRAKREWDYAREEKALGELSDRITYRWVQ